MKTYGCDSCLHRAEKIYKDICNNPNSQNYLKMRFPNTKACTNAKIKMHRTISIVEDMMHNILAYDKRISKNSLNKLNLLELLNRVHELDQKSFASILLRLKLVKEEQVQKYLK